MNHKDKKLREEIEEILDNNFEPDGAQAPDEAADELESLTRRYTGQELIKQNRKLNRICERKCKEYAKGWLEKAVAVFKKLPEDEPMTKNPVILELDGLIYTLDKLIEGL